MAIEDTIDQLRLDYRKKKIDIGDFLSEVWELANERFMNMVESKKLEKFMN